LITVGTGAGLRAGAEVAGVEAVEERAVRVTGTERAEEVEVAAVGGGDCLAAVAEVLEGVKD